MSWLAGFILPSSTIFKHEADQDDRTSQLGSRRRLLNGDDSQEYAEIATKKNQTTKAMDDKCVALHHDETPKRPYWQCMLAGGLGGSSGDMLMHSIDTVKTRQQGDPSVPSKYGSLTSSYWKILRQEGFRRGLYSGVTPAFLGSFPGTVIFFGSYEFSKRHLIDAGMNHTLAYLTAGFLADFVACFVYVPSEVLKTRMQLQGRFQNPHFQSGYNYRNMTHAVRTIVRTEGALALYSGYKATILRDLPFSALQFAFYEQEQNWARNYVGGQDIGMTLEIATAASAGGIAGTLTCPLDVIKTKIQTQVTASPTSSGSAASNHRDMLKVSKPASLSISGSRQSYRFISRFKHNMMSSTLFLSSLSEHSSSSSVVGGLRRIWEMEGMVGLFRGVGPRAVWTSVQSGTMLVLYQVILRRMAEHSSFYDEGYVVS